ncbi:MAG: lipoprotein [Nitratireductor sp.]|nr:lipoprotein [Nitratireductor sp.]
MRGNGLKTALAFVLLAGLLAVSGCGRKGPLEPPPGSVSPASSGKAGEPATQDDRIILDALI